ncbi:MAG: tRNA (guanosine(37)-N1)-methyltransferase TrmD [Spongiibacteraceae bacterium]|jgi:tRNA (guanine37-N1)-methyltransferase|nr:tRNA (guanosine(37)-N1)-methyltransferase TrmD [Spongiibacteraceae bacterium]
MAERDQMDIAVVSLFPEMFRALTDNGISGRAVQQGLVRVDLWNPRDFTHDRHRTVDDRPYGGGPGMLLKVEPARAAIQAARAAQGGDSRVLYLSPQGRRLDQAGVMELAARPRLIVLAGRYEGVDERLIELEVDEEWSIGDYVLSGGELAAMVLLDAVIRQLPGALGHDQSATEDSFATGLLDCPHYTRPEVYEGRAVPAVLLSGDHEKIRRWRLKQALARTRERRPDLLAHRQLDNEEQALLAEYLREQGN